ncbi:MAG: hypothetical protein H6721_27545 [Sandaracinus sp.]|nr:hypothetical protein [Sandaracinus sp.]MCB9635890.1 hypothetical protein [Sandaracinus sp.]
MSVVTDTSTWPFVRWTVTGRLSAEQWTAVHDTYVREVLVREEPFVQLWDFSGALPLDPKQRHEIVSLSRPLQESERRFLRADAWVSPSWLVRGSLSALHLMLRPPYPSRIFATVQEAEHFALRHHPSNPRRSSAPPLVAE